MGLEIVLESFELLKKPSDIVKKRKEASIGKAVGLVLSMALLVLMALLVAALLPFYRLLLSGNWAAALLIMVLLGIELTIGLLSCVFIGNIIPYVAAVLMKGKATYTEQVYLTTLPMVVAGLIITALVIIFSSSGLSPLVIILAIPYILYVQGVAIRDAHGISNVEAAVALLSPIILSLLLWFVFRTS